MTIFLVGDIGEAYAQNAPYLPPDFDNPRSTDDEEIFARIATMRPADYPGQDELLQELISRAQALVGDNWSDIEQVAVELAARGTLTGDEVLAVMGRATDSA